MKFTQYVCAIFFLAATVVQAEESHSTATNNQQSAGWRDSKFPKTEFAVNVKILGFNDFHGHISSGMQYSGRPIGGAAVFASYLRAAQKGIEDRTFIVHAGDAVGASPLTSGLLQDEPTMLFLNQLANPTCTYRNKNNPRCNMVGTLGNHEFDRGQAEILRLINGGKATLGPVFEKNYQGAKYPYVSANVVSAETGKPILPPYVIKQISYKDRQGKMQALPIAFIGAALKQTPTVVMPSGVAGLKFLDEAEAINRYVPEIRARGIKTIVVLIHQGNKQEHYAGPTDINKPEPNGLLSDIVSRLDDEIDVVVSGHTHAFTNAIVKNAHGKPILLTQAFSYGMGYADIDLQINPKTRDVVAKFASIVPTFADQGPGLSPDPKAAQLVAQAEAKVAPIANQRIAMISADIKRVPNESGESVLGNLIADAQRATMQTKIALMNPGGVRTDILYVDRSPKLPAGTVSYGDLFAVQPFGNRVVKMSLTGQQIIDILNAQFPPRQPMPRILQVSGLSYKWTAKADVDERVSDVRVGDTPIDKEATYSVAVNNYLAEGGDQFNVFKDGKTTDDGLLDIDVLVEYVKGLPQPIQVKTTSGRIVKVE